MGIDDKEEKWIYESPDGGKTVFRRLFTSYDPSKKEHIDWKTKKPTGKTFLDYPWRDHKKQRQTLERLQYLGWESYYTPLDKQKIDRTITNRS